MIKIELVIVNNLKLWTKNGVRHRDKDQPALIFSDGTKEWYSEGELHRENGAARIYTRQTKTKYIHFKNGIYVGISDQEYDKPCTFME